MPKVYNTNFADCFSELNVSRYEYDWTKFERMQVKRVSLMLFLGCDTFSSLGECSQYVFAQFGATPSFVHPFLPCLQHGYTKKKYVEDITKPENSSLLAATKDEFIQTSKIHINQGKKIDAMLFTYLIRPAIKIDLNRVDQLSWLDTVELAHTQRKQRKPQKQQPLFDNLKIVFKEVDTNEVEKSVIPQNTDVEDLTINVMYLKDKIDALIEEQQNTQKMLQEFMSIHAQSNWIGRNHAVTTTPTATLQNTKRNKVLVVGMWPRQFESLRLAFAPEFFENFDINYISSDIIRKDKLENSGSYDHVFVNTASINHTMEQLVKANCNNFVRYSGGVSALRTLLLEKAKSCDFGTNVRDNIKNWIL